MPTVINKDDIPYTGGRHYEYMRPQEFIPLWEKRGDHPFEKLEVGKRYFLYRLAKDESETIVYLKLHIDVQEISMRDGAMFFTIVGKTKGKTMRLEGYGKHWFVALDLLTEVINETVH